MAGRSPSVAAGVQQGAPASTVSSTGVAQVSPKATTHSPTPPSRARLAMRTFVPRAILPGAQPAWKNAPASPPFVGSTCTVDVSGDITSPIGVFVMRSWVHWNATLSNASPDPPTKPTTALSAGQSACHVLGTLGCGGNVVPGKIVTRVALASGTTRRPQTVAMLPTTVIELPLTPRSFESSD